MALVVRFYSNFVQSFLTIIAEVFSRVIVLYIGVAAGYLFIKSPLKQFRKLFINITINVFTPFLIFVAFLGISLQDAILYPVISIVLVTTLGIYAPKLMARITRQEDPSPAELCTATFPNGLNFPFPVIYAFAPAGLGLASIFLGLSIIARNTVGFWISESKVDKDSLKQIALFPPIWGIIAGIATRSLFPDVSGILSGNLVINWIFELGIFFTIMTIGFGIKKPSVEYVQPILRTGVVRYVIMGIIGFSTIIIFQPELYIAIPFVVQLMAPPAVYNGLYAEKLGLDVELTAQVIIVLTLVALLLLPVQLFFIQSLT